MILGVGNELTEGRTQDVHARYLGSFFRELQMVVRRVSLIPDDYHDYADELRRAVVDAEVVVTTGGLGPTSDDLTREVVADVSGRALEYHNELWEQLTARFPRRRISETNKKQVMIPAGFRILENRNGTAPGFAGHIDSGAGEALIVSLPGPPGELLPMVEEQIRPLLAETFAVVPEEVLRGSALLVPESELEEALQRHGRPGVVWGTRTELHRISFNLRGGSEHDRHAVFYGVQEELGESRIRPGDTGAAELVLDAARTRGWMLVTAESCTGGLISKLLTDVPGSSDSLWGGIVAYSNEAKRRMLAVENALLERYGAVSEEVAAAMARGALDASDGNADLAIAVTGIAGPGGGTPEKPVGTVWCAVADRDGGGRARRLDLPASRDRVRRWSAIAALLMAYESMEERVSV
ncbi:MAG: nicotinamide-nucleotide amidohydrolase family protein [Spirochaetaceae bacterium]